MYTEQINAQWLHGKQQQHILVSGRWELSALDGRECGAGGARQCHPEQSVQQVNPVIRAGQKSGKVCNGT